MTGNFARKSGQLFASVSGPHLEPNLTSAPDPCGSLLQSKWGAGQGAVDLALFSCQLILFLQSHSNQQVQWAHSQVSAQEDDSRGVSWDSLTLPCPPSASAGTPGLCCALLAEAALLLQPRSTCCCRPTCFWVPPAKARGRALVQGRSGLCP